MHVDVRGVCKGDHMAQRHQNLTILGEGTPDSASDTNNLEGLSNPAARHYTGHNSRMWNNGLHERDSTYRL